MGLRDRLPNLSVPKKAGYAAEGKQQWSGSIWSELAEHFFVWPIFSTVYAFLINWLMVWGKSRIPFIPERLDIYTMSFIFMVFLLFVSDQFPGSVISFTPYQRVKAIAHISLGLYGLRIIAGLITDTGFMLWLQQQSGQAL